jgi:calmodulin
LLVYLIMLTQADIDKCREAFERFDKDGSGSIDAWELKETLKAMGQNPTEEEVFQMLAQVDDDGSGTIDFPEFLKVIEQQKEAMEAQGDETDVHAAWVAMGGEPDKSGEVDVEKLRRTIKAFELTIDIDKLIVETDTDGSGFIDYEEFKAMFS